MHVLEKKTCCLLAHYFLPIRGKLGSFTSVLGDYSGILYGVYGGGGQNLFFFYHRRATCYSRLWLGVAFEKRRRGQRKQIVVIFTCMYDQLAYFSYASGLAEEYARTHPWATPKLQKNSLSSSINVVPRDIPIAVTVMKTIINTSSPCRLGPALENNNRPAGHPAVHFGTFNIHLASGNLSLFYQVLQHLAHVGLEGREHRGRVHCLRRALRHGHHLAEGLG